MTPKTVDDTRRFANLVAEKQGWILNRDDEFLDMLLQGLTKNNNRYGYYSCPCRDASGTRREDEDIICPCHYCRPDQAEFGHCYCGLYLTPQFAARGIAPASIPERRPWKG
ncbi:MAG: ferredoxin:thioredoxin reductase [Spirochaetes bacterium]|nr:ferredoxin:thioredoxin reductase [Spirochaetota bacterium]